MHSLEHAAGKVCLSCPASAKALSGLWRALRRKAVVGLVLAVHVAATAILWSQGTDNARSCLKASQDLCPHANFVTADGTKRIPTAPSRILPANSTTAFLDPLVLHSPTGVEEAWAVNMSVLVILGVFVYAEHLRQRDGSLLASEAALCMLLNVLRLLAAELRLILPWCSYGSGGLVAVFVVKVVQDVVSALFTWRFQRMAQVRLEVLERSMGKGFGAEGLRSLRHSTTLFGVLACLGVTGRYPCFAKYADVASASFALFQAMRAYSYAIIGYKLARALNTIIRESTLQAPQSWQLRIEAKWCQEVLRKAWIGMVVPCVLNAMLYGLLCVVGSVEIFCPATDRFTLVTPVCYLLLCLIDFSCMFWTAGFFREQDLGEQHSPQKTTMRMGNSLRPEGDEAIVWDDTVRHLAARSISVSGLLEFYKSLGREHMPGFKPSAHTTRDVVRQAVIPMSRVGCGGQAYVDAVRHGNPCPPETMVTHTWDCLFVHLVASVVADSLEVPDYGQVAQCLLEGRQDLLEKQLAQKGGLQRTYWICAFCVNQHAGICGSFPRAPMHGTPEYKRWDSSRRDSVTGELYPCCPCEQQKQFNDHIGECELNKFDAVMAFLSDHRPGFRQLVAVDRNFDLFTRAWCIAELVQGAAAGIPQFVRLLSSDVLDLHAKDLSVYAKLATLTVATCQASRQEDKDAILEMIPDLQAFDARLQALIFGKRGLFGQRLVGFGALEAAALTAYRVSATASARDPPDKEASGSTGLPSAGCEEL